MSEDIIKSSIAVIYSWEECCILTGEVTKDKKLSVVDELVLRFAPIEEVAKLLKEVPCKTWLGNHEPLATALKGRCEQVDLDDAEIEQLAGLFKQLKSENRISFAAHVKIKTAVARQALQILLKSFISELCGMPTVIEFQSVGRRSSYFEVEEDRYRHLRQMLGMSPRDRFEGY